MADNNGGDQMSRPSLEAHVRTYDRVIGLLKWGAVAVFVIAFLVVLAIAR